LRRVDKNKSALFQGIQQFIVNAPETAIAHAQQVITRFGV
jgi:hypothetical protein